jgi:hypothetical protein
VVYLQNDNDHYRVPRRRIRERSVGPRLGDIRHSVVVTGDGNSITATFGDTGAPAAGTPRQVFVPDRRRPPRPGELPRELDILAPTAGAPPLLGREPMLADLHAWLNDAADMSVHALIGEAGSGKTRLALELCR